MDTNMLEKIIKIMEEEKFEPKMFITIKYPKILNSLKKKNTKIKCLEVFCEKLNINKNIKIFCISEETKYVGIHAHLLIECEKTILNKIIKPLWIELIELNFFKNKNINKYLKKSEENINEKEIFWLEEINWKNKKSKTNLIKYMLKSWGFLKEEYWYSNINGLKSPIKNTLLDELKSKFKIELKTKENINIVVLLFNSINIGVNKPLTIRELIEFFSKFNDKNNKEIPSLKNLIRAIKKYLNITKFDIWESKKNYDLLSEQIFKELYISGIFCNVFKYIDTNLFSEISEEVNEVIKKKEKEFIEELDKKVTKYKKKSKEKGYNIGIKSQNNESNIKIINKEFYINSIIHYILTWMFTKCEESKFELKQGFTKAEIADNFLKAIKQILGSLYINKKYFSEKLAFFFFEAINAGLVKNNIKLLEKKVNNNTVEIKTEWHFKKEIKEIKEIEESRFNEISIWKSKLLMGVFFVPILPWNEKWKKKDITNFFDGMYVFNEIFHFASFAHRDIANKSELKVSNLENYIKTINQYMKQRFKIDSLVKDTQICEKIFTKLDNDNIEYIINNFNFPELLKKRMKNFFDGKKKQIYNECLELFKEKSFNLFLILIAEKEFSFGSYIDIRGRIYLTGSFNNQSSKWLRNIVCFAEKKQEDLEVDVEEIYNKTIIKLKKIDNDIENIFLNCIKSKEFKNIKEMTNLFDDKIWKFIENVKEEKYLKYFLILIRCLYKKYKYIKDGNNKVYIPYVVFTDFHAQGSFLFYFLLKDYNVLKNLELESFDYYLWKWNEFIMFLQTIKDKEYVEDILMFLQKYSNNVWRSVIKRSIMTLIYSATRRTLRTYFIEGLKKNNIFIKDKNIYYALLNYFDKFLIQQDVMVYIKKFSEIIFIIWKQLPLTIEEKKKLVTVQCNNNFYTNYYVKTDDKIYTYKVKKYVKKMTHSVVTKEIDVNKMIVSNLVNIIHYFDGIICHYIMTKMLLSKGSNIVTIHDSFGVTYAEKDLIRYAFVHFLYDLNNLNKNSLTMFYFYKNLFDAIEENIINSNNKWNLNEKSKNTLMKFYNDIIVLKNDNVEWDGLYSKFLNNVNNNKLLFNLLPSNDE